MEVEKAPETSSKELKVTKTITLESKKMAFFSTSFLRAFMHFLFRLSISFFVFYILGNSYNFLDSNLFFILRSLQIASALSTIVAGLLFIVRLIISFLIKKKFPIIENIVLLFVFLMSLVFLNFATIVLVISEGRG